MHGFTKKFGFLQITSLFFDFLGKTKKFIHKIFCLLVSSPDLHHLWSLYCLLWSYDHLKNQGHFLIHSRNTNSF